MARRSPGEGTVFKRKDRNLWQALVPIGYDENGKRIRKPVFAKTKAECERKKRELQAQALAGAVALSGNLLLSELLERWIAEVCSKRLKSATVKSYQSIAKNHINPQIGRVLIKDLKSAHVASVLSGMGEKGKAGSTQKHAYTILNAACKWAIKMDYIPKNPCDKIEPPKPGSSEQAVYTPAELATFLDASKGHRLHAVFVLAVCTGARQGELFGLKWSDVDLPNATISIRRKVIELNGQILIEEPKTKKSRRQITLPKMAVDALHQHRKQLLADGMAGIEWVFPSESGHPIRRQSFNRWAYKAIVKKSGLRFIPFKNLRHSHATALLASGEHPKVVQERLGHSRISTTLDVYSHTTPTMQIEAAKRIDDLLSGAG